MQNLNISNFTPPTTSNTPNQAGGNNESQKNISSQSPNAARISGIGSSTRGIQNARRILEQILEDGGLDLLTSSVEFQKTGSFIQSSYVVYPSADNIKEPLAEFLSRYPDLLPIATQIEEESRPFQSGMNVKTNWN